jgi:hypothetical protein
MDHVMRPELDHDKPSSHRSSTPCAQKSQPCKGGNMVGEVVEHIKTYNPFQENYESLITMML